MRTLLKSASVYRQGAFVLSDIRIENGLVAAISPNIDSGCADTVFHFPNCYIVPGFLDAHVHLRQPGFSYKETIYSGTRAAARGGCTAVITMPNLDPAPDSVAHLAVQEKIIEQDAAVDVYPYACITREEKGREIVDIEALAPRVIGFSDDGVGVQDRGLMREAMCRVRSAGSIIAAHCEDNRLLAGGGIHDGRYAQKNGYAGISSASEYSMVERDIELVRDTGCRYHVCHVSAKESVELIRAAKKDGLPVSCEATPHHLLLTDEDLLDAGCFRMNPPIRARGDRDALWGGLADGTVDMVATDHAPHTEQEKAGGLRGSLNGVVGLETAFRVLNTGLVLTGILPLERLVEAMAVAPRKVFGVPGTLDVGQAADLCVIDPAWTTQIDPEKFYSMGRSTPFARMRTTGDIVLTLWRGETVWEREEII